MKQRRTLKMKELSKRVTGAVVCVAFLATTTFAACSYAEKAAPTSAIKHNENTTLVVPAIPQTEYPTGSSAGVTRVIMDALDGTMDEVGESDEEIQMLERHVVDNVGHAAPTTSKIIETVNTTPCITIPEQEIQYVSTWSLNVRNSPSINGEIIGYKLYGREVSIRNIQTIPGEELSWAEINFGDGIGYVAVDYLSTEPLIEYMGEFFITYYCPCAQCCGQWSEYGITASGRYPRKGRTIAADSSIPFGTKLIVDGVEYIVEDRGSGISGNHIDIYMNTHSECFEQDNKTVSVFRELTPPQQ